MILAQDIIKLDPQVLGVFGGVMVFLASWLLKVVVEIIHSNRQAQKEYHLQDEKQITLENKLVDFAAESLAESKQTRQAFEKNTEAFNKNADAITQLTETLTKFRSGIETKLDENTQAIKNLAEQLQTDKALSIQSLVGIRIPLELADGTIYTVSIVEENQEVRIKIVKQEKTNECG